MKTIPFLLLFLFFTQACFADSVIKLKNGKTAHGKLIEETSSFIKLNAHGIDLTYWKDEIESFTPEGPVAVTHDKTAAAPTTNPQNSADVQDIRKTIGTYLAGMQAGDLNLALGQVSKNFLFKSGSDTPIGYDGFANNISNHINTFKANKTERKFKNLLVNNLVIDAQKNEATALVQYQQSTRSPSDTEMKIQEITRAVALSKEGGVWKITKWPTKEAEEIVKKIGHKHHNKKNKKQKPARPAK